MRMADYPAWKAGDRMQAVKHADARRMACEYNATAAMSRWPFMAIVDGHHVQIEKTTDLIARREYGTLTNPAIVAAWMAERLDERAEGDTRVSDLWDDMTRWMRDLGADRHSIMPVNTFGRRLKSVPGINSVRWAMGTVIRGVKIRELASDEI